MNRIKKNLLLISIITTLIASYSLEKKQSLVKENITIEENNQKETTKNTILYIKNNQQVKDYLNYDHICFQDVRQVLKNNQNISLFYKEILMEVINQLEKKVPNIDLTCLYENIKLLTVEEISREEMVKRRGKKVVGYVDAKSHKIVIVPNLKNISLKIHHETIHLLNYLLFKKDGKIFTRQYYDQEGNGYSLNEGLTEWLNTFLFGKKDSYQVQVADIEIIRTILKQTKEEMAEHFSQGNYHYLYDELSNYLNKKDLNQLLKYFDKELKYQKENSVIITTSEIQAKYDTLLEAMIVSRRKKLDQKEIDKIYQLFKTSISNYFSSVYGNNPLNEDFYKYLNNRMLHTLMQITSKKNYKKEKYKIKVLS